MGDTDEAIEEIEIPSDDESIDGNDSSDDELLGLSDESQGNSLTFSRECEDVVDQTDGIWSKKRRTDNDLPFVEHVCPTNISDDVKTPGDVFCFFYLIGTFK